MSGKLGRSPDGVPAAVASRLPALLAWDHCSFEEHFALLRVVATELDEPAAVMAAATAMLANHDEELRALGFDLIAAVAGPERPDYLSWVLTAAGRPGAHGAADLRWSVVHGLTRCDDERTLSLLLDYADDPDSDVRWQVAAGAPNGLDPWPPALITVMLKLMQDDVEEVRDWATFSLGVLSGADTPAIREGLAGRLQDPGGDTAGEACVGLAMRKDPRALPVILSQLVSLDVGNLYVEAAAELGDPTALPLLEQLQIGGWAEDDPRPHLLEEAIAACWAASPGPPIRL